MQMSAVSNAVGADLILVEMLSRARTTMTRLQDRIYDNYGRNPGIWQAECVALRDVTQGIVDAYETLRPTVERAFENLQLERLALSRQTTRSIEEDARLQSIEATELWANGLLELLPQELDEPVCPGLRR